MHPTFLDLPEDVHRLILEEALLSGEYPSQASLRPINSPSFLQTGCIKLEPDVQTAARLCCVSKSLYLTLLPHLWRLHRHRVTLSRVLKWGQPESDLIEFTRVRPNFESSVRSWLLAARKSPFFEPGQLGRAVTCLSVDLYIGYESDVDVFGSQEHFPWATPEVALFMRELHNECHAEGVDASLPFDPNSSEFRRANATGSPYHRLRRNFEGIRHQLMWTILQSCPNVEVLEVSPLGSRFDLTPSAHAANRNSDMWARLRSLDVTFSSVNDAPYSVIDAYLQRCPTIPPLQFLGVQMQIDSKFASPGEPIWHPAKSLRLQTQRLEIRSHCHQSFRVLVAQPCPRTLNLSAMNARCSLGAPLPQSLDTIDLASASGPEYMYASEMFARLVTSSPLRHVHRLLLRKGTDLEELRTAEVELEVDELHVLEGRRTHQPAHLYRLEHDPAPAVLPRGEWPQEYLSLFEGDARYDVFGRITAGETFPVPFKSLHLWGCACALGSDCTTLNVRRMRLLPTREDATTHSCRAQVIGAARAFHDAVIKADLDVYVGNCSLQAAVLNLLVDRR